MTQQAKKLSILFALVQGFYWSSNCMMYAYIINVLTNHGFSTFLAGLTLTFMFLLTIVVQPLMGYISDTFITAKKVVIGCFAFASFFSLFIPKIIDGPQWLVMLYLVSISIFDFCLYSVIDVWAVRSISENPGMDFAFVRSGGSLFYAVTALVMGKAMLQIGENVLFIGHSAALAIGIVFALMIDEYPCPNSRKYPGSNLINAPEGATLASALKQLLVNRKYVIAVLTLTLYQIASRVTQSYLAVVAEYFGGNAADMGVTLFFGASAEVIVMIVMGRVFSRGGNLTYAYFLFPIVMAIRIACLLIPGGVIVPISSQLIQAIAVGIYLRVFPDYISSITPRNLTATACTFAIAISLGVGSVPGNILGGWMIENYGMHSYIIACVIMALMAAATFLPNLIEEYNHNKSSHKA